MVQIIILDLLLRKQKPNTQVPQFWVTKHQKRVLPTLGPGSHIDLTIEHLLFARVLVGFMAIQGRLMVVHREGCVVCI